ncbi:hypothetical protein L484_014820 [Morus notabilis]|uniref:CCHC-type domain-containing protein n=1 Tax=Morus notabilis TaxID=981085 RepID=W9QPL4_9ROSA|nr:hypothetical protein L484_014820 [Morus notabilis]
MTALPVQPRRAPTPDSETDEDVLKEAIQDHLALTSIWSLMDTVNLAYRVELQQTKTSGRHQYGKRSFTGPNQDKLKLNTPGTSIGELRPAQRMAKAPPPTNQPAPGNPRTTNPYAKPHPDRCFRCHEVGHRSTNCLA